MPTNISAGQTTSSTARVLVRDSSANLIALILEDASTARPYISTDDGSSWTAGDTTFSWDVSFDGGAEVDGSDNIHIARKNAANATDSIYSQFSIGTGGAVTVNVSNEVIISENDSTGSASIALDSTGTVYTSSVFGAKTKGTAYDNIKMFRRDGADSWTDLGSFVSNSTTNYSSPIIAVDSVDDIHVAYDNTDNSNTLWNKWDASATSYVGQETVTTGSALDGSLVINASDEPIVSVGQSLWERSGGTWSSDQFTSDTVGTSTVAKSSTGNWWVIYETGGDLRENHNTFGSFATSDVTDVVTNSATLQEPTSRWQYYNENDPTPDTIDFLYYDSTNGNVYFAQENPAIDQTVSTTPATTTSSAISPTAAETKTLSGTCALNGSAVSGAKVVVYDVTAGAVEGQVNSDSNGNWSLAVPTGNTYHVAAQYDDGTDKYNEFSKPFLVT